MTRPRMKVEEQVNSYITRGHDIECDRAYDAHRYERRKREYAMQKQMGIRNERGSLPFKRLKAKHLEVIAHHLEGRSVKEIADAIEGFSFTSVLRVLKDPLAQTVIADYADAHQIDLNSLVPLAIRAVRTGLNDEDVNVQLAAVGRYKTLVEMADIDQARADRGNVATIDGAREKLATKLQEIAGPPEHTSSSS